MKKTTVSNRINSAVSDKTHRVKGKRAEAREKLIRDLAWDFCQRVEEGDEPDMEQYLAWAPDEEAREEIKLLISMDRLARVAAAKENAPVTGPARPKKRKTKLKI